MELASSMAALCPLPCVLSLSSWRRLGGRCPGLLGTLRRRQAPPGASCPTGRSGTPRDQYLQDLVTQFQNATNEESKEKIVANLANFAYDPFNYAFMRQVVLELFLDCITEPNEKLVEFGIGGICNSCEDPANSLIITQCGGIPLVVQCLWSLVRNTISISEDIVISS
ncbi:armadillo repeat-containing protein 7 [Zea mays]|uniref:armadillo repeat-containing protein 7 n=1 Tax=Zea mays TaxID=4577 RepID=UPI0004DE7F6F|nr:armadillo repeat-containing protein 7 [Zea mays]|eukprot:XP_008655988.1 armadillo repeat-containing protein 7 [Zea mays]